MPSPRCHWEGCENRREVNSLCCYLHKEQDRVKVEEVLLTILAQLEQHYQMAVAMPEISSLTPTEVEALRAGRALFGIVDEAEGA